MQIFYILFFLLVKFIVEGSGLQKSSSSFDIQVDTGVTLSVQPFKILNQRTITSCAFQCSQHSECCSSTYTMDNMSCCLYSCCFPPTIPATKMEYLRKHPDGTYFPTDCSELPPGSDSGVYTIYPTSTLQVNVYCDMRLECQTGWTVVQRRIDGTVDFYVPWATYKTGFGIKSSEYWIGNDILSIITNVKRYIMRFDMEDGNGVKAYAEYDTFIVADESTQYELTIGGYSGTAGDALGELDGSIFSTLDRKNDAWGLKNCAQNRNAGWWFYSCSRGNPNGLYQTPGTNGTNTIYWRYFREFFALKSMSMKIKPL